MTPIVSTNGLTKRFGGIVVADRIDLNMHAGEVLGLIGPNGAGKTSLFNLICGTIAPDAGTITIRGSRAEHLPSYRRARLGLARTWQTTRLFASLSLVDNLLIAQRRYPGDTLTELAPVARSSSAGPKAAHDNAMRLLTRVGLESRATALPSELSYGQQKLVGLVRALMNDGDCLLLDEPMAGVEGRTYERIKQIVAEEAAKGKAIAVVEHNVGFIRDICNTAIFMFNGRVIASGSVGELTQNRDLTKIYFGGQA
jgi:branched-chain amino acid transport system ATP-binding protein